jgi:phosphatidylglycerol:prolipoprotein diacylglycerol transferase
VRQTLFWIPYEVGGVPLFGWGVLLALWAVLGVGLLVWLARKQGWNADTLGYLPMLLIVGAALVLMPKFFPGGLPIRGYGFMLLVGVSSAVGLAAYRARRVGINPDLIFSMAFWLFVAGIVGARLFHVIEYWSEDYRRDTLVATLKAIVNIPQGGLVFYGSLIGGAAAFALFVRRHRLPFLAFGDLVAPSVMLGLAFGRVGCLLNGCCFGGACELPWAVTFPQGSPPYQSQLYEGTLLGLHLTGEPGEPPKIARVDPNSPAAQTGLETGDQIAGVGGVAIQNKGQAQLLIARSLYEHRPLIVATADGRQVRVPTGELPARSRPVHPTQLYSAIFAALLCWFLVAYYPYRRRDGEVAALMLTLYPIGRFLIEIIRIDESAVLQTGMSISQNVSVLILIVVAAMWTYVLSRPRGSVLPIAGGQRPAGSVSAGR